MSSRNLTKEENRLNDIAEQYKQRGYKVSVSPPAKQLPKFLSRFRPDIVAEGPDESVVVEVKSSGKARGTDYWKALSKVIQQHPGWRLELVVNSSSKHKMPETIRKDLIKQRLQEGQQIAELGMLAASLLTTWSAAEAAMRLASKRHEIDFPDLRPATVISKLYTDGILEREEYDFLVECMQTRNAVVHGFYAEKIKPSTIKKLQQIACRLLE